MLPIGLLCHNAQPARELQLEAGNIARIDDVADGGRQPGWARLGLDAKLLRPKHQSRRLTRPHLPRSRQQRGTLAGIERQSAIRVATTMPSTRVLSPMKPATKSELGRS